MKLSFLFNNEKRDNPVLSTSQKD